MLNAFAHMRHFYLRLRWNKVVAVVSRQNKKIIALVDTVLVADKHEWHDSAGSQTVSLARYGECGIDPGMP